MNRPAHRPPTAPWHADPLEWDRWLDGEGSPSERRARDADVAADPALLRRADERRAFLAAVRGAATRREDDPVFDARIRAALAAATSASREPRAKRPLVLRAAFAAAALVLVGLGVAAVIGRTRDAQALHPADLAAQLLSWQPRAAETAEGLAGCAERADVLAFPPVQRGELLVKRCAPTPDGAGPGASAALLTRPEELPVIGYVAVPAPGSVGVSEVGVTELEQGRIVVLDVLDHGRRVYLALDAASLRRKAGERPEAWSCAACHGPERQAQANPHRIVLRRAP